MSWVRRRPQHVHICVQISDTHRISGWSHYVANSDVMRILKMASARPPPYQLRVKMFSKASFDILSNFVQHVVPKILFITVFLYLLFNCKYVIFPLPCLRSLDVSFCYIYTFAEKFSLKLVEYSNFFNCHNFQKNVSITRTFAVLFTLHRNFVETIRAILHNIFLSAFYI